MDTVESALCFVDRVVRDNERDFPVQTKVVYYHPYTKTVVVKVVKDNGAFIRNHGYGSYTEWTCFIVVTPNGHAFTERWVSSEANVEIGGITEDDEIVRISRHGTITAHFGIQLKVGDLVVKKANLKPLETETT